MADTRGTFRLKDVRQDILNDEYVSIPSVFVDPSTPQVTTAGYYIGGSTSSPYVAMSNIDKLTYANDTISTPPTASGFGRYTNPGPSGPYNYFDNLTVSNNGAFALFTNYRICNTPTPAPVMYKHDFSTDDVTTVPSLAPVFPSAGGNGGAGTAETAWWHSTTANHGSYNALKITYATESYSSLPSGTGFPANGLGSNTRIFQDQLVAGYTPASGPNNPGSSVCKKLTFSTDTFTDIGWQLGTPYYMQATVDAGSDDNTALVAGGYSDAHLGGGGSTNVVKKITLNNNTVSSSPSLPASRYDGAGHSSGSGGSGYVVFGPATTIFKAPFSTYSWSTIPTTLSSIRRSCRGYSGSSKALKAGMSAPIERWFDNTKPGAFAVNFDGSGDRLSLASHADLQIGSSDYTIEFWVYKNADTPDDYDCWAAKGSNNSNTREFAIESMQDQTIDWYYATSGGTWITAQNVSDGAIPTSQWVHIVAQKGDGSGYFSFYVDGVRKYYSTTGGQTLNTGGDQFCIAGFADYNTVFEANVKISNFRFVKGTAVYSGPSFTVPTEPLGNITNTKLLCCNQSTTTGATVKPGTITAHGDPTVSDDSTVPLNQPPAATPTASTFPSVNPALNVFCIFKGGYGQPGTNPVSFNAKMTYSNETIAYTPNMHYTIGEMNTMAGGSSTTKGYTAGGWGSGVMGSSRAFRTSHVYATDVTAKIPGSLSGGNGGGGMFAMNSDTEFWSGGGGWSNNQYSYVDKLVFATDSGSANPARLSSPGVKFCSGIGNKTLGFVCGGNQGPHGNNGVRTNIDKLVYSTGTMSRSPGNLSLTGATGYKWTMAVGTKDQGYIGGGGTNKLVFSTETVSTAPTGVGSGSGNGVSSVEAGYTSASTPQEYIFKYTFATETSTTLPGKFPSPSNRKRHRMGAVSTSMFGGAMGSTPNVI